MRPEEMTEEQRLIMHQYVKARDMMERLDPYLRALIPPKFEIGQLVTMSGQSGGMRIYNRFLTEAGRWFYQMQADTGTYAHKHSAGQYEDSIMAVPEE